VYPQLKFKEIFSMSAENHKWSILTAVLFLALLYITGLNAQSISDDSRSEQWQRSGQDLNNSRSQPEERAIRPANVHNLNPKWVFTTGGDVSATPAVGVTQYISRTGVETCSPSIKTVVVSSGLTKFLTMTASMVPSLALLLR
jgi:hypothetical protein